VLARVVRAGADGDQAAISEPLDTVGADGVRSDHHAQVVSLQELVQVVGSKVNDVVLLLRISGEVVLETLGLLALMWIGPEEVDDLLVVLRLVSTQFDLKWSCNSLDSFNILHTWADTAVAAEDLLVLIFDYSS